MSVFRGVEYLSASSIGSDVPDLVRLRLQSSVVGKR